MTSLLVSSLHSPSLPSVFTARPEARKRLRDFLSSHIRNPNTRRAYMEAVRQFSAFCAEIGIVDLGQVEPVHVAAFVEAQLRLHSKPTVKQRLAALRMLFDWMVVGQVLPVNPAHAVRGDRSTRSGAARRQCCRPTWRMIRRRALLAGIKTEIGCYTSRATGITAYLKNGGKLEIAQQMAAQESSRTTRLYDRRNGEVSLDEVEKIGIKGRYNAVVILQKW